jgi:acyl-coenzyme A thioesterase PaaI-like protein
VFETLSSEESTATTGISINYVSSAREGEAACVARLDHRGRRAAFLSAEVRHDSGRLLATAIGTFAILSR